MPEEPAWEAPYELVRKIRGSICVLGPLLARTGRAKVALPGGDAIGSRPLDMHFAALSRMGADIEVEHGYIVAEAKQLRGSSIWLDFPSVGATENILTAAVLAKGTTVIDNAAREPEIVDLCQMLVAMGAQIGGIGSSTLEITGVDSLRPATHDAVADRIVAGTWAMAAVATRGDVTIRSANAAHLEIALDKLGRAGAEIDVLADGFRVAIADRPKSFDVVTLPYPGLATDLQPQAIALLSVADGVAMITENLFEARFMFCDEIARMGADVRTDGHHAVVRGRERLSGAPVRATDIRAGVGLVIAGLVADGHDGGRGDPPHRPGICPVRGAVARAGRRRRAGRLRGVRRLIGCDKCDTPGWNRHFRQLTGNFSRPCASVVSRGSVGCTGGTSWPVREHGCLVLPGFAGLPGEFGHLTGSRRIVMNIRNFRYYGKSG